MMICTAIITTLYQKNADFSIRNDLMRANIEALTDDTEFGTDVLCYSNVNTNYDPDLYIEVRECMNCSVVKASSASNQLTCSI